MVKKLEAPRSPQEGVEEEDWYGALASGEISLPTASEEVLGLSAPRLEPATPKKSPWRPDEVRKARKIRQRMEYLKKRKKKRGPKRKYKTYWMRKNRKSDLNWKDYNLRICSCPYKKWMRSWQIHKTEVLISKEEFLEFLDSLGGYPDKVKRIVCFDKKARRDNFLVVGWDKEILYRGTNVPESYPAYGRWIQK